MQVGGTAGEDGSINQIANDLRGHAAVAKKVIHTRVHGHDPIEHAGLWISVKLNQDRRFAGDMPEEGSSASLGTMAGQGSVRPAAGRGGYSIPVPRPTRDSQVTWRRGARPCPYWR